VGLVRVLVVRVLVVRVLARRAAAPGGAVIVGALVAAAVVAAGGQARAATSAAPFGAPAGATLTQLSPGEEWSAAVTLETASLCARLQPAGNKFSLVTSTPDSVTGAARPRYDPSEKDGKPKCATVTRNPLTTVTLTFTPSPVLSAVPQTATLVLSPPQALLVGGAAPAQVPLTVRRTVSPWQYVIRPGLCGAGFVVLFIVGLMRFGVRPKAKQDATTPSPPAASKTAEVCAEIEMTEEEREVAGVTVARKVIVLRGRVNAADLAGPADAPASLDRDWVHRGKEFWRAPLFAGATWSFSGSWATSIAPLTTLVGAVLTASGAVAGLVPGVDLGRFALLITLVGALAVLAPLLFSALNTQFPDNDSAPPGEVVAARLWVMVVATSLTVFAVGAEIGFVGWVLGYDLVVAAQPARTSAAVLAGVTAVLFLFYSVYAIRSLTGAPDDSTKNSTFMI
jgi:hypothetical protein